MTIELASGARAPSLLDAAVILARASCGLILHGLLRPGRVATIERATGKVAAR